MCCCNSHAAMLTNASRNTLILAVSMPASGSFSHDCSTTPNLRMLMRLRTYADELNRPPMMMAFNGCQCKSLYAWLRIALSQQLGCLCPQQAVLVLAALPSRGITRRNCSCTPPAPVQAEEDEFAGTKENELCSQAEPANACTTVFDTMRENYK